jgi:hypothetical protein
MNRARALSAWAVLPGASAGGNPRGCPAYRGRVPPASIAVLPGFPVGQLLHSATGRPMMLGNVVAATAGQLARLAGRALNRWS